MSNILRTTGPKIIDHFTVVVQISITFRSLEFNEKKKLSPKLRKHRFKNIGIGIF